ncbi:MAG: hypothetical protein HOD97_04730 [Candidatus Marinimicrobia bacterium]|nr:hypothetical protein [Candidatus Neomarinimicrobiota bacterium]MBT3618128.1 hypothetical protein [Candidatus Neomarinimicrobiota bacterium]MBT3828599.1 hypothetical protein [Candidatus Neomarinimicrobiota bacterium]MBT3996939.1 hypothetical protein [Candidatus Neomarinimicrobiota bacterium]MBT4280903.1 hypothetical protein [Candidatus Neomarinimicrobiota bacterium]
MIYLLLSKSHVTGAHCSNKNGKYVITSFFKENLAYPLLPYFGEEEDLSQILIRVLSNLQETISFEDNKVAVSVRNTFVKQDITEVDEALSLADAWDYSQWKNEIQWGPRSEAMLSFSRVYQKDKPVLHTIHCDSALINSVSLTLKSLAAIPVWMGAESVIMLAHPERNDLPVLFNRTRGFDVFHSSHSGPAMGKLISRKGNLNLSYAKGNVALLESSLGINYPKLKKKPAVFFPDRLTKSKRETINSLRVIRSNPFKNMSIENADTLQDLSLLDQSIIFGMMSIDIEMHHHNFFLNTGIQETSDLLERDPIEQSKAPKVKKKKKALKKPDSAGRERFRQLLLSIFITLIFIAMYVFSIIIKEMDNNKFQIRVFEKVSGVNDSGF